MFSRPSPEEHRQRNAERRAANLLALARPARTLHEASYEGTTRAAKPKTAPHRNRRLLDLAAGKPCLLLVPGICNHRLDTTVSAHSNWPEHGKAGARKADDHWSCWSCAACHCWLDQGTAPGALKRDTFMAGMGRQITAWQAIDAAPVTSPADRRAARWALALHGVAA